MFLFCGILFHHPIYLWGSRWRSGSSKALCTTEPGFDPRSRRCTCIWFPLASPYLLPQIFLLHLKLGFLNKSISGIIWSNNASADCQLIWHYALSPSGDNYVARHKNPNLFIYVQLRCPQAIHKKRRNSQIFWHSGKNCNTIFIYIQFLI